VVPPSLEQESLLSLFADTGSPARPKGRHNPISFSLVTVETPAEPTWPLSRSVRNSQGHSASSYSIGSHRIRLAALRRKLTRPVHCRWLFGWEGV